MTTLSRLTLSPHITAAILAQPSSGDRAVRGAELLVAGKVQRLPDDRQGADHWLIYGSAAQPYAVSIEEDRCNCPDRKRDRFRTCKHLHAARLALAAGIQPPQEIDPDPELWAPADANAELDAEIAAKLDELIAAGIADNAEILAIGDWLWIVGDADPDEMDAHECRWHDRRCCYYWRPIWAAVEGFNEYADLDGLAAKYGLRRRVGKSEKKPQELAMLLVPKLNRDDDGELWA